MPLLFRNHDYVLIETNAKSIRFENEPFDNNLSIKKYVLLRQDGLLVSENRIINESWAQDLSSASITLQEIASAQGEWCVLASDDSHKPSSFVAMTDAYGYATLFYSLVEGKGVVISPSYSGAINGIRHLGVNPTINIANYITVLPNWIGQFIGPMGESTMANEVNLLSNLSAIFINNNDVIIKMRTPKEISSEIKSPEELIDMGIEQSSKSLIQLANTTNNIKKIRLSGGADSRLVLGLLNHAGVQKEFKVQATDPRTVDSDASRKVFGRDIEISNHLRERYGMQWAEDTDFDKVDFSFKENLDHFLGYRSNFGYDLSITSHKSVATIPVITLLGGGGEVFRAAPGAKYIPEELGLSYKASDKFISERDRERENSQIADWLLQHISVDNSFKEISRNFILDSFNVVNGNTFTERVHAHYFQSRNRQHFGTNGYTQSLNVTSFHPLSNLYFLEASRLVPYYDRSNEFISRIIFENTDSSLLNVFFESEKTTENLVNHNAVNPLANKWQDSYDSRNLNKVNLKTKKEFIYFNKNQNYFKNSNIEQINYLKMAFAMVEENVPVEIVEALHRQHEKMLTHAIHRSLHPEWLIGKVASALEVLYPIGGESNGYRYATSSKRYCNFSGLKPLRINYRAEKKDGWNNYEVPKPILIYHTVEDKLFVSISCNEITDDNCEFAVYLMHNKVKIASQGYSENNKFEFSLKQNMDNLEVIGFVRTRRPKNVIYQVRINI